MDLLGRVRIESEDDLVNVLVQLNERIDHLTDMAAVVGPTKAEATANGKRHSKGNGVN